MSLDRWRRIEDLYHAVLERQPSERVEFLTITCSNDIELRREVESLLAHEGKADRLLESPVWNENAASGDAGTFAPCGPAAGSVVCGYRISRKLGSGGMGEVYRATDLRLQRDVALKLLAPGLEQESEWLSRFKREAQVLASLNHPHIAVIYGLEESDGLLAIAMELVEGFTLAERIARGAIPIHECLVIARQIAKALEYAHEKGIIHRDLKPANIMVTGEGQIKLLDFGIAQPVSLTASKVNPLTGEGGIAGTVGYMSPEQVAGPPVDPRSDLFSFGVVIYEMVMGERPFTGNSAMSVCDAVLHAPPRDFGNSPAPGKLKAIIRKLLEKDPANRGSAGEAYQDLEALDAALAPEPPVKLSRNAWIAVGATVVLAAVLAGWLWHRSSRERWARGTATPEIVRLVEAEKYVKAATLAQEARAVLPEDPTLEKLWMRATGEVSIASEPSGADVSIRPYRGDPNAWQTLGETPIQTLRLPRAPYLWRVTKSGFAASFLIAEPPGKPPPGAHSGFSAMFKLRPEQSVPPDMVVVPGGMVSLAWPLGTARAVQIGGFLIDRHEVTNQEYKKFVDAGGYQKREFWKQPFARDGRTVPWEEAVALFVDATGRPGPATWEAGAYPKGRERHPVAGVSWYEAMAYAEFAGKRLPTAYHWTRASQAASYTPLITSGSNFRSEGTQPVGSESALSGFGTTDMAGNVKEWCLNEARDGKRFILGGGFGEPNYYFHHTDAQSPWDRLANFGFRCVKLDSTPSDAATAPVEASTRDYWKDKPVPDAVFEAYTALYSYDKGELNAQVEQTTTTEAWSREKVTFDAAYGAERVMAYLFLPRNASGPLQTIVYFPGAFAFEDDTLDLSSVEEANDFLLRSGRALIVPIYKGMYERRDGLKPGGKPPAFFRDHVIAWAKDLGRSIDYLETRKDIDITKVAYFGFSLGGVQGALLPAVEKRIRVAILSSGGFQLRHDLPEVDTLNFVGHVTIPVLMLSGRYDNSFPLESSQNPLFYFLGTADRDKKHVIYEGGHGAFPHPDAVRECLAWLDKYLGPVRR